MSTYQPLIPTGTVDLDVDYANIKGNFQQLDTSFAVNHTAFSVTPFNGMHTQVQMVEQSGDPSPIAGTDSFYTKVVTIAAAPLGETFFKRGGVSTPIQMTSGNISDNSTGYSFLPGGILIQWGSAVGTNNLSVNFPVQFTSLYNVQVTLASNSHKYGIKSPSLSGFQFSTDSSSAASFYWVAIGKARGI